MLKDKIKFLTDYVVKHSKIVFPIVVIAAVAITVSVALTASNADRIAAETAEASINTTTEETVVPEVEEEVPMVLNEDPAITTLITSFYNAMALGDEATLNSVCSTISVSDMLHYLEKAKYIEMYPVIEIYTKPGYDAGSTIAFVYYKVVFADHEEQFPGYSAYYICTNEQGELYINRDEFSEEANEYIGKIMSQDDVVEFNNRVNVEYNEFVAAHPELLEYLSEMNSQVSAAVGTQLADLNTESNAESSEGGTENVEGTTNVEDTTTAENSDGTAEGTEQEPIEAPVENAVQYATATTTVNVRSSDSELADKLGKVSGGTQLQVLEQKANGWSKVIYEEQEGFIKSEFLQLVEAQSAEGIESIGTVTATTNVNVRSSASETAESLGFFVGGDTAELLANENGWCKINYNGKIGYVKADYVQ